MRPATSTARQLRLTERYTLRDADTIEYEVTIEDPKVFTRPWKISMALHRQTDADRIFEYQCQAELEEANGAFERDERTWYPAAAPADNAPFDSHARASLRALVTPRDIPRLADGKPDLNGYFQSDGGGANYGLESSPQIFLTPESRGIVVDPTDGKLPYQAWARAERIDRALPHRGYEDPTAHCFVGGHPSLALHTGTVFMSCRRRTTWPCCSSAWRGGTLRSTDVAHSLIICAFGRATRSDVGRATHSSSRRRT